MVEKYFSKYGRGDLVSYETMNEVFESPEQLADLRTTVDKLLKDLRGPLEQVPEEVKGMAQGGIGSSAKRYASGLIGYLRRSTGHKFSTFLSQNKGSLLFPAEFFSKYTDFLLKHITKEIAGYGEQYGIPDELFERLGLLNEFDKVATVCGEHDWNVPIDRILSVINKGILDSYGHLSTMLMEVQDIKPNECKDDTWVVRTKSYKYFVAKTKVSVYRIMDEISDIQNEGTPEGAQGNIQSDSIYDVTSPSNKAGQSEEIDLDRLKNAIRKINNSRYNDSEDKHTIGKGIIPLGAPADPKISREYHTFMYVVGSKKYFLKSVNIDLRGLNSNDVLFETLDSPYIAKTYRVLYNHVVLKDNHEHGRSRARSGLLDTPLEVMGLLENDQVHDQFWVVSEYLDVHFYEVYHSGMNTVRQLASDVLNGLDYLQAQGVVHGDLHPKNIQGTEVQVNGQTEHRFKIIDFGLSYSLTGAGSIADTPGREDCGDLASRAGTDLSRFMGHLQFFIGETVGATEDERLLLRDFISECRRESGEKKPNMKKLLKHPFITGKPLTKGWVK